MKVDRPILKKSRSRLGEQVSMDSPFFVPPFLDLLGWVMHRFRGFWLRLGRLESSLLADKLRSIPLKMPIYICGLARSGSTLLHEIVAAHPGVATLRSKDYPIVYTPAWWRRATAGARPTAPRERTHGDRVFITSESPEALEEILWMAFFPRQHDPSRDNRLMAQTKHPAFESFYIDHIRKVLLAEQASRYVAKANYHVARLAYLVRLFPDARFLIPLRAPVGHIASLIRQHERYRQGQRKHPRSLRFMRWSGHFEFGLDRRPMNLGDRERVQAIRRAWAAGEEVRGWARYWDMVHEYLAHLVDTDEQVRNAAEIVRFESLCAAPAESIRAIQKHCALTDGEPILGQFAPRIQKPDYYTTSFSPAELAAIHEETARTAARWGY